MIYEQEDLVFEGEGAGIGAGDAGASVGSEASYDVPFHECPSAKQVGIDTAQVLGKCDHKKDGYMSKDCFHLPGKIKTPLHRWEIANGGSKRKKGKNGKPKRYAYEKGMRMITTYDQLVKEGVDDNQKKPIFVYNLPHDKIEEIVNSSDIDNQRFNIKQFTKYCNQGDYEFVGLFSKFPENCLAMAVLKFDVADLEDCYVAEIQCLKKGYGKELMKALLKNHDNLWLLKGPNEEDTLLSYYRQPEFGFDEHIVKNSVWDCDAHFFYKFAGNPVQLTDFLDKQYSKQPKKADESMNESKNKITKSPKVINQKKASLKVTTTSKPKKIQKVALKRDQKEPTQVKQGFKHVKNDSRPLAKKMMSKSSLVAKKSTKKVPEIKDFKKSKLSVKQMSFPRSEIKDLKDREQIITTRVEDDYDNFRVGDIVKTPWGKTYKIVSRMNIINLNQHPFGSELTDEQIKKLSEYSKMSVLTLNACSEMKMNESIIEGYEEPYTLDQIKQHYDSDTYEMLANDPVHRWRAQTGIELIYREPTFEELERIWKNWNLMTDEMKKFSDEKSIELFGVDNETHYYQLQDEYDEFSKKDVSDEDFSSWHNIQKLFY